MVNLYWGELLIILGNLIGELDYLYKKNKKLKFLLIIMRGNLKHFSFEQHNSSFKLSVMKNKFIFSIPIFIINNFILMVGKYLN